MGKDVRGRSARHPGIVVAVAVFAPIIADLPPKLRLPADA
jgi:hypothetical protein